METTRVHTKYEIEEKKESEREEERPSIKVTHFLEEWLVEYLQNRGVRISWLSLTSFEITSGYDSPHCHTIERGFSVCITVGDAWLKTNMSDEDKAKYIADRMLSNTYHTGGTVHLNYSTINYTYNPKFIDITTMEDTCVKKIRVR